MQSILTNFADSFAVSQVVCDDFSQLREVPAVPLSAAHNVVIELLIQVIQKSLRDKEKKFTLKVRLHIHIHNSSYYNKQLLN